VSNRAENAGGALDPEDVSTSTSEQALGFLLPERLVEAMGGASALTSDGRARTFIIELPIIEDPLDRLESDRAALIALSSGRAKPLSGTVLYIEDNPSNLKLIEEILSCRTEIRLLSAMRAETGLSLAFSEVPDLILLDLHLPDMLGEEVLQRLQAHPRTKGIPVTVLTGDANPERMGKVLMAGARNYLTKPFGVRKIVDLFERTLG
jgi:CheY-like chemotaxis protein